MKRTPKWLRRLLAIVVLAPAFAVLGAFTLEAATARWVAHESAIRVAPRTILVPARPAVGGPPIAESFSECTRALDAHLASNGLGPQVATVQRAMDFRMEDDHQLTGPCALLEPYADEARRCARTTTSRLPRESNAAPAVLLCELRSAEREHALSALVAYTRVASDSGDSFRLAKRYLPRVARASPDHLRAASLDVARVASATLPANDVVERWADALVVWDGIRYEGWTDRWAHRQVVRGAWNARSWEPITTRYALFRRLSSVLATRRTVRELPLRPAVPLSRTLARMERAGEIFAPRGGCMDAEPASVALRWDIAFQRDLRALAIALATVAAIDAAGALPSEPIGLHDPALADPLTRAPLAWSFDGSTLRVGRRDDHERDAIATTGISYVGRAGVAIRFDGVEPEWGIFMPE